jgi:putative transposase
MPRQARCVIPGIPLHIMQRGVNKQTCFPEPSDRDLYVRLLEEAVDEAECRVHAYVVMTNHVHLLATPGRRDSAGAMMKRVGQIYSQYVNRKYQRCGTLWSGRPKFCEVHDASYLMICHRYIELNPVRGGLVRAPEAYPWSSYGHNGLGAPSWITPHELLLTLGTSEDVRRLNYRQFVAEGVSVSELEAIRIATRRQRPLGDEEFIARLEAERLALKKRS